MAVERTGRRHGFREATREEEGTRSRLDYQKETKRQITFMFHLNNLIARVYGQVE